jgi:hypothetical protein
MRAPLPDVQAATFERLLGPLHRWVWRDLERSAWKLLRFAETEAEGGRDLARAAELTGDPLLRSLYLRHAEDEYRHAELFRQRGRELLLALPRRDGRASFVPDWLTPGERGLDDLRVDEERDASLLAFLHLSEKAAAGRFAIYRKVLADPKTKDVFGMVLRDEAFHMNYTHAQLQRVAPAHHRRALYLARLNRLWKGYLRLAMALAGLIGGLLLIAQYFVILPAFALLAKRAARRERRGFSPVMKRDRTRGLHTQY